MSGIACIVGAGDMTGTRLYIPEGSLVIAADGGLSPLKNDLILVSFSRGSSRSSSNINA